MTQWGVDAIFNPAKRHMDDEKRRLQSTRAEVGDNSGGRRIDLLSGKVVIHRTGSEGTSAETPEIAAERDDAPAAVESAAADGAEDEAEPARDVGVDAARK